VMRKFALFFGLILLWNAGFATHQRAGEITYKHIRDLTYEFTIITYTYTPSPADRPTIEISWGDNTKSTVQRKSKIDTVQNISKNEYVATHTYPSADIYSVTFEDPNRNAGIINIPNSVNIPFFVETKIVIDNFMGPNNSPRLLNPPLDNGCVGTTYYHNVGAYDPDGDSLSYKLIDCRGLNGLPIPGYTKPRASQYITIDEITGDLVWETPVQQGEYNIAILISEYRKGKFMGSVVRDMQITIGACNNKPPVIICADTCVVANTGNLFSLEIIVTDDEASTQVTLTASGEPYMVANSRPIPINVTGQPTLQTYFEWLNICEHIKKNPYRLLLKATDNGPQVKLSSFKTVNINVIAPAPQNLSSYPVKNSVFLEWDKYSCPNAKEIHIYKKTDSSFFEPDYCETGVPSYSGFRLLEKINASNTSYTDNGAITPVAHGREYCYRIIAVFSDGTESRASNETCAAIANDAPMIIHVDIEQTSENEGAIFVSWLQPPEIDTLLFPGPNYEYRIFRSENNLNDFNYLATNYSLSDTSFTDKSLNTEEIQYFYKIEFWGENNLKKLEYIETSDPASSIFLNIYETDKRLKIKWNEYVPWKNEEYIVYRFNENTQQFDSIATTKTNNYDDTGLENENTYCYFVTSVGRYTHPETTVLFLNRSHISCGTTIDNVPPDQPKINITTDCENVTFKWGFPFPDSYLDAYKYYIYYQPNYQTPLFCVDSFYFDLQCLSTQADPTPCAYIIQNIPSITGCYAMIIKDKAGNSSEITPKICFDIDECKTYSLPNVFTPDGDGVNDTWVPFPYTNVQKIDLEVHDRWGKRVFKTENSDINWDGTDEKTRRPLPEGTYYYGCNVYLYTLSGIKKKFISGVVMIFRR